MTGFAKLKFADSILESALSRAEVPHVTVHDGQFKVPNDREKLLQSIQPLLSLAVESDQLNQLIIPSWSGRIKQIGRSVCEIANASGTVADQETREELIELCEELEGLASRMEQSTLRR